ncbi:MAG: Ig-like domain-containing protein, partial [Clostridiaceae bacterium]
MPENKTRKLGRIGRKAFQIFLCILLAAQSVWFPTSAKAESESSSFYFRGFSSENISTNTFAYAITGATLDGTTVRMTSASGSAVGFIALDEVGHNISNSVDLGGLEISFSVVTAVIEEGTAGADNDVPTVEICFCSEADPDAVIGTPVTLQKTDPAVSGNVTLSSHASIPVGTRGIFIFLSGTSTTDDNTVVFSSPSLKINDAAAPSCDISYNTDWTSGNVTVTVTAADGDAGLEGIYVNGTKVSTTSPYTTTATTSGTQYQAYSKDYAGKVSATVDKTVNNIDKVTPATPTSATLSTEAWTNQDVTLSLPTLSWGSAAPEFFIYQIGTGAWQTLPEVFKLTDSGRYTLRLAVKDAAGNTSGSVERYAQIDKVVPTIDNITKEATAGSCSVDITYSDGGLSGLNLVRYAAGNLDAATVLDSGTDITGGTFTVYVGGEYTICVSDHAGNVATSVVLLSTKPTLTDIADTTMEEDVPLIVPLSVTDAETNLNDLIIEASASDSSLIKSVEVIKSEGVASLKITPVADQSGGPVTITVSVTDASELTVSDQFTVTIDAVNDDPVAVDDTGFTLNEDANVKINVLANDTDLADGDTLTIDSVTAPSHGTAVIVLGQIKYTPNENYVGEDSFSYTISDGHTGTATAFVYVTVTNVNDAPTAMPDEATCTEDSFVYIDALSNDTDLDVGSAVESISLLSCDNGANGTAEVKDGKILYTPNANFYGEDSFTYTMEDSAHATAAATVTVKVSAVPDDPQFVDLNAEYTVDEDSVNAPITFSISDVETPANSLMLQASSPDTAVDLLPNENISVSDLGDESDEVSVLVTPMANQTGDVTLTLTLGDGFTTVTQTVLVHIAQVNDAPTAKADSISYDEDTESVSIPLSSLIGNDTDPDHDTLTFVGIGTTTTVGTLETVGDPVTSLLYKPLANYEGTDSFTYLVSDGTTTSTGTCTLTAKAVNDAPTIEFKEISYTVDEDTEITGIRVTIGDKETAVGSLLLIGSSDNGALVPADNITIVNNDDGTADISVLPAADANGTVNIIITVSDGAASAYASVPLTISPKPDAPVAAADNIYVPLSGKRVFSTLLNDHDVDGDTLTITGHDGSGLNGTLLYDEETKLFTYYSAIGEVGTGTFTYTVSDGALTATGTVTLHINSVAHAPAISSISDQAVEEDQTLSGIPFLVEDEDYGDVITISVASSDDSILKVSETSAVVTDNGDGSYSLALKPVANASGTVTITVTATDKASLHTSSSFTLRVLPQNDAPIAVADEITLSEDSSKVLELAKNDSDPDGDTFWVNYVSTPVNGYLLRSGTTYTYYPYYNWNGSETLSYQITDGRAYATATAVLTIAPVNDAPVAWDDYQTLANTTGLESAEISVLGNDGDPEGDAIHVFEIVTQPKYGTVSFTNSKITYTRSTVSPNDNGADSFTYRIIDRANAEGDYRSDDATVHIGVVFHSSLYTYGKDYYCLEDSAPADINLPIHNPNEVEYSLTLGSSSTALGELTIVDHDTVHFTPAADANGTVSVQYTVTQDGGSETSTNTLYIRVYPVNDPPVIDSAPTSAACEEDSETGASFDVAFHDVDCARAALYFYAYIVNAETGATVPFEIQTQVTRTETGATVTVIPMDNVNGTADLIIGVSDGMEAEERTIALTITPVDDAPGVNQLNATTYEDVPVKISVLRSNSEVDGDTVSLAVLEGEGPEHGEVEVLSGGIIVYHPDADYFGDDSFTYTLTDQTTAKLSSNQTASIHVVAVNDQPEIKDLGYYQSTNEDKPANVLFTVHDVDNDLSSSTHYTLTSDNETLVKSISIVRVSGEQMKITVVPNDNAYGTAIINIVASDGELTAEGAFQLKVVSVNDTPEAADDAKTVEEAVSLTSDTTPRKTTATMYLTDNDTDVEDATLKIVKIENVSYGTVINNGDGTVTISCNGDYSGTITFDYTVMDKNGASASASATLTITPMNDPPNAVDDSKTINEDNAISINVLGNDTDVETDTLSVLSFGNPAHGTVVTDDANLLYTPAKDYNGTDSFIYTVSDGHGGTDTATVSIKIKPVNDAPEIAKHSTTAGEWTMDEDSTASFNFVVSDPETQASNLLITIQSKDASILLTSQIKLTTNSAGYKTITVRSNADAYGEVPVYFLLSDGQLTTQATYYITINGVNDAPVADDQLQTIKEDGTASSTLTATDKENNPLTYTLETAPLHGTVEIATGGAYTYTPNSNWYGTDTFEFLVDDAQDENHSDIGMVTVIVKPENDAPNAVNDTALTDEDTAVSINVLGNDTDSDLPDDTLTIASVTHPTKGTAVISEGKILYTPNANLNGTDTFSYTVSDEDGKTDTATVTVTIAAVNDTPSGGDDTATVDEDHSVTIHAAANDDVDETTNPDIEDVTVTDIGTVAHGTAS